MLLGQPDGRDQRLGQEAVQRLDAAESAKDLHERLQADALSGFSTLDGCVPHPGVLGQLGLRHVLLEPEAAQPGSDFSKDLCGRICGSYMTH